MTLNRRAFVVLFPIVLLAHIVGGGVGYMGYRHALITQHVARLQQNLSQLQNAYAEYASLDSQLLYVVRNSSAFLTFIDESDAEYRTRVLGIGVQDSLLSLVPNDGTSVSCSIFQSDGRQIFYFDNGTDPFETLGPRQAAFAQAVLNDDVTSRSGLVTEADGTTYLVMAAKVQARTGGVGIAGPRPDQSLIMQVSVRPRRFATIRRTMAREYGAPVELLAAPPASPPELSATVQLAVGLYARETPSPAYLRGPLARFAVVTGLCVVFLSLLSVGMLMLLVRRYIIAPVEELDRQVTAITENRRMDIDVPDVGEVGRLAANVRMLHGQLTRSLRQVRQLYETDSVTGIGNRIYFNEKLDQFFHLSVTTGRPLTMLFIDLDNFKQVNDMHGHRTGDALLGGVASALSEVLQEAIGASGTMGIVARLSGDEFTALILADSRGAVIGALIDAFLLKFRGGFRVDAASYPVTASIGVAAVPGDAETSAHLFWCADQAMYHAKAAGRNTVAFYADMPRDADAPEWSVMPAERGRATRPPVRQAAGPSG
ncbi:diguanylate cyclase [Gluconacetobacter sacchari DSM 12717]|uniref:GGDEF domain-containing protein n=2 Tax=Gluconacetobacter sacchari TaxID=92759 RepID=A0A7W4IDZ3_9PROT|nr:GGDEF domain-containing protein [Gluconacetobacter sacchari]MBB2161079.1 GGDEF domain-containing protein [Gluconacetobacter sacchari]GBQ26352.1 diguanylate cyclase [Gluconacetobacter sacchari DSM 12717]